MVGQLNFRAMRSAALAMAILISPSAMAAEDTTRELARNLRALENLTALGGQIKALVTPELGFTDDNIRHWSSAVDVAFAPELLEADFLAAMDDRLSDEVRNAALAFDRSPIGQESYELVAASHPVEEGSAVAGGKAYLETAPAEENALFVELFEVQSGTARANQAVDIYFRAMAIAAEPITGREGAEQWVAGVQDLRTGYVENYFSVTVGIYSNLQSDKLVELVEALGTADMIAYAPPCGANDVPIVPALSGAHFLEWRRRSDTTRVPGCVSQKSGSIILPAHRQDAVPRTLPRPELQRFLQERLLRRDLSPWRHGAVSYYREIDAPGRKIGSSSQSTCSQKVTW